MPPIDIVRGVRRITQKQMLPNVPKRWAKQFNFGLKAYSLKPFQSANSNGRSVVANVNTAATKTDRLLANIKLAESLGMIFNSLNLVHPDSFVNVDHSDMNRLMALVGAVQTRKGRALPCLAEAIHSDRLPGEGSAKSTPRTNMLRKARAEARLWQSFTGHVIDSLQNFHDRLGFWPKLVFDRGFGNESLITHLSAEGAIFYIRLKAGRLVEFDGQRTEVKQLVDKDAVVELFGLKLRIIRSAKNRRASEPWYILTNDFNSSHYKIVTIYYHRFEIEETFKDVKHIWDLKITRLNSPNSLKVILWLISIGIALIYLLTKPTKQHIKKQASWIRQGFEQLSRAYTALLWGG
jgi:Transposase DDE domain